MVCHPGCLFTKMAPRGLHVDLLLHTTEKVHPWLNMQNVVGNRMLVDLFQRHTTGAVREANFATMVWLKSQAFWTTQQSWGNAGGGGGVDNGCAHNPMESHISRTRPTK